MKRLRDAGVIEADVSIVQPKVIGRPITMLVLVSRERERADIVDRFKQSLRDTADVMNGYYVTGESDIVLILKARSMEDFEAFTRKFLYENTDIEGFKTMVVMDRVKTGFSVPIDLDDFTRCLIQSGVWPRLFSAARISRSRAARSRTTRLSSTVSVCRPEGACIFPTQGAGDRLAAPC